jgi:subtilase family serine protease
MKCSIKLIAVAALALLFGFTNSGLAQESDKPAPPVKKKAFAESPQVRFPVTTPPVVTQPVLSSRPGTLIIPKSSIAQQAAPGQTGLSLTAHTNIQVYLPSGVSPQEAPPFGGYGYETPASIACHYNLVSTSAAPACNPNATTVNPTGGSQTIAIVDAFDDPNAPGDLAWFSLQFGIPLELSQFHVVWATTSGASCGAVPPDYTGGWEVEESLDIEWAHAMAPSANLYLVEACSNSYADLLQAVSVATNLVQCGKTEIDPLTLALGTCPSATGAGIVSMSWGGGEFSSETALDGFFNQANVEYVASSGDSPGVIWPCASDYVICAGGTTIRRNNGTNGLPLFDFDQETAWVFSGGGISAYEPIPCFEAGTTCSYADTPITHCTGVSSTRCVPDVSFDADPYTGVYVYDTFGVDFISSGEWYIVGGTSVSAPSLAGILDVAETHSLFATSSVELSYIYNHRGTTSFIPISTGFCGPYMGSSEISGWTFCNGIGVVNGYGGE